MRKKRKHTASPAPVSKDPVYQRLAKTLSQQILSKELPAGAKLPEERRLAELHKVNRYTLRNAIRVLEAQGLVNRVPRKGTFVVGSPGQVHWFSSARTVLLIQCRSAPIPPDCYYGRIFAGIQKMTQSLGLQLEIDRVSSRAHVPLGQYKPPRPSQVAGVIVCGTLDEQYIGMYCSDGIPVVVVDYKPLRSDVACVETDVETEACDILKHLVERGHKTVGVVALGSRDAAGQRVQDPDIGRLLDSLRRAARATQFQVPQEWVIADVNHVSLQGALRRLLLLPNRPSSLLCFHEDLIGSLLHVLEEMGLRCPEDISVIARNAPVFNDRQITHLAGDPEFMGRSAVRLLLERIKSPLSPIVRLAVASRLVRGTTTGPSPILSV